MDELDKLLEELNCGGIFLFQNLVNNEPQTENINNTSNTNKNKNQQKTPNISKLASQKAKDEVKSRKKKGKK